MKEIKNKNKSILYMSIALFEKKQLIDFNEKVKSTFNLLTISRKVQVVGSSALKNIRYVSDYDLNELFKREMDADDLLTEIYRLFKSKFVRAKKDPDLFITDLKCGLDSDGEPLRWDYADMMKGSKVLKDGRRVSFQDCILSKSTFKLDLVRIIDGLFTEFSDNYYIKLGESSNFFPNELDVENIKTSLKKEYDFLFYTEQNLFKGLKRCFSYYLFNEGAYTRELTKLLHLFNSNVGLAYQAKNQLSTISLVIENKNKFKQPKLADVRDGLSLILANLEKGGIKTANSAIKKAIKLSSLTAIKKQIDKAVVELYNLVNITTLKWVVKNVDVPLY